MRYSKAIFVLGVVLVCSHFWPANVQKLRENLYLNLDPLTLLGSTLLAGLLCTRALTNSHLQHAELILQFMKKKSLLISVCLFVVALLFLYLVNQKVLHGFMNSADEHSCYFLAECIRRAKFWATPPAQYEFFDVTHIGNKDGKWFSVYPPGWPLLFGLGLSLNVGNWINPMITTLSLVLFFAIGRRIYGFSQAYFSIIFMITSPFLLLNGASYFSHSAALLMICIFAYSYMKWQEGQRLIWPILCAFSLGYGLGTRYLTVIALAIPILALELKKIVKRKNKRLDKSRIVFSGILCLMLFFNLYYNYLITGNFFEAPNHFYHSWERLGFHSDYRITDALLFFIKRLAFLVDWSSSLLLIIYMMALITMRRVSAFDGLFRYGFLCVAVAYLFYYSWGGNQYGPRYYFEGFPFMTLFAVQAIHEWWMSKNVILRKFLMGALLTTLLGNGFLFLKHAEFVSIMSSERKALYELAEKRATKPALIFIRGFLGDKLVMSEEDAVRNHPNLRTPIIYAHDLKEKNSILIKMYPERTPYLGYYDRSTKDARLQPLPH